jgi:predicted nucleic acid-binding protein
MTKRARVLDSWGVVAFFEDEQPAAAKMEEILADSHEAGIALMMTAVNLGEVWYSLARAYSEKQADQALAQLLQMGVEVVPADWDLAYQSARLKVRGGISYADCFAVALAKSRKAEVVTGDTEFRQVEGEVKILWV